MSDVYNLQRLIVAQADVYQRVYEELERGRKTGHWMWFIFPQIIGLGSSSMAVRYAIASLDEARNYLAHPVLGTRLRECSGLLLDHAGKSIGEILPWPDDLKLKSSMTLFARADRDEVFTKVLDAFFAGEPDSKTIEILSRL